MRYCDPEYIQVKFNFVISPLIILADSTTGRLVLLNCRTDTPEKTLKMLTKSGVSLTGNSLLAIQLCSSVRSSGV